MTESKSTYEAPTLVQVGSFRQLTGLLMRHGNDRRVRLQGRASVLRLVSHTTVHGVTVAADRADVLAWLSGAEIDVRQVATRLLWPVPHPLLNSPLWGGVEAVEPEQYLVVAAGG